MINMGNLAKQKGMMLLMLTILLTLGAVALYFSQLNAQGVKSSKQATTAKALQEAKAALIGYAITYDDTHSGELYGYLPCPDINPTDPSGEGAQSICGSSDVSMIGRFPWKALDLQPIKDGENECLWYAVSGNYKNNPKTPDINPSRPGLLEVLSSDGISYLAGATDRAVAIIFSPGAVLANQDRAANINAVRCGGNYSSANYLDTDAVSGISNTAISGVANAISTVVAGKQSNQFNDQLVIIKRSDIFAAYCKKYAKDLRNYAGASSNACNNAGSPITRCSKLNDYLQNCSSACAAAANTFISNTCLTNITDSTCQAAILSLGSCHA